MLATQKKIKKRYLLFLLVIFYYCFGWTREVYSNPSQLYNYLIILLSFALMAFFLLTANFQNDGLNLSLLLLCFVGIIPTLQLYFYGDFRSLIANIADMILWIGVFHFARKYGEDGHRPLFCIAAIIHLFLFIPVLEYHAKYFTPLISVAYYSLWLLPFLLEIKNIFLKIIFILIAALPVLFSEKRTGFLALIVGIALYLILEMFSKNTANKRSKLFLGSLLSVLVLVCVAQYLIETFDLHIFERFQNVAEDEGSGRMEVFRTTLKMYFESSPGEIFFGHGFNSVYIDSPLKRSAHNDFLEVLYDYGIIGFICYIYFLLNLTRRAITYYKKGVQNSSVFLASIAMAIVFSMTSHLVIYPTYYIYLCIYWGSFIGMQERKERIIGLDKGGTKNDRNLNIQQSH